MNLRRRLMMAQQEAGIYNWFRYDDYIGNYWSIPGVLTFTYVDNGYKISVPETLTSGWVYVVMYGDRYGASIHVEPNTTYVFTCEVECTAAINKSNRVIIKTNGDWLAASGSIMDKSGTDVITGEFTTDNETTDVYISMAGQTYANTPAPFERIYKNITIYKKSDLER